MAKFKILFINLPFESISFPWTIKKDEKSYYLFKVHSERQEGKKYPVLVQDELIGTISKDGIKYNNNY